MKPHIFGKTPTLIIIDELGVSPDDKEAGERIRLLGVHLHERYANSQEVADISPTVLLIDSIHSAELGMWDDVKVHTEIPSTQFILAPQLVPMKEKPWIEMNNKYLQRRFRTGRRK